MLAAIAWWALYQTLIPLSEAIVYTLPVARDSHLGSALQFFFYDTPKVLMLLTAVVMVMGMVNSYFTPERTRALLAGRHEGIGNILAATLGIVTPFCSCSAVPLFIGFVQAGVPLGVTFSFLISAPMVNEVALTLLFALFGWKVAGLYLGLGLTVAIVSGWIIGRLKMEGHLEDWVRNMPKVDADLYPNGLTLADRLQSGFAAVREIVGKVWPYILAGIGRVEMWRGSRRFGLSVAAPFVWRCPSNLAVTPFPHPPHRTGHADFPHPALGQDFTPSPTPRCAHVLPDARAQSARRGARVDRSRPCVV